MKTQKMKIMLITVLGSLLTGACGMSGQAEEQGKEAEIERTVLWTLYSLKELVMDTFIEFRYYYVESYYKWFGFPVETEYRIFNELLQPGFKTGKRYRFQRQMAEKVVEELEWEVMDIREESGAAEIDMIITNRNMADAMGYYEISVWDGMIAAEGSGMWQMVSDMADLVNGKEELLAMIDAQEETCTIAVTVTAYREDGGWRLHLDDAFINAFMGNLNRGDYS